MHSTVVYIFAIIGCATVSVGAVVGVLVATGILKLGATLERHDDD